MYKNFAPRKRNRIAHGHPAPVTKKPRKKHRPADHVSTNPRVVAAKAMRAKMVGFAKTPVSRQQLVEKFKINKALMGYYLGILLKEGSLKKVARGNKTTYVQA